MHTGHPVLGTMYYNKEQRRNDSIYNAIPRHGIDMDNNITMDNDYKMCDYSVSMFSTMGAGINAIYQNNVTTPVRVKKSINTLDKMYNISKTHDSGYGVYIVEKYTIDMGYSTDVNNLVDYYLNLSTLDKSLNESLVDELKSDVHEQIASRKNSAAPVIIRFFTFISDTQINNYLDVYVRNVNILLTRRKLNDKVKHPWSQETLLVESSERLRYQVAPNVTSIDITNNEQPNKLYYIKIGNTVSRLTSSIDSTTVNGAIISFKKDGELIDTVTVPLEELEEYGIYDTNDGAMYGGDNKLKIEDKKLQFEYDKLSNEYSKLANELNILQVKYNNERHTGERKIMGDVSSHEYKIDQSELDIERAEQKHQHEMSKSRMKKSGSRTDSFVKTAGGALNAIKTV